jgi:hypothetical protein
MLKWSYRLWEVPDNRPPARVDAVTSMSLSPAKDGTCGPTLKPLLKTAAFYVQVGCAPIMILSNRYSVAKKNLAIQEKLEAVRQGVPYERTLLPVNPWSPEIRNTFMEAKFAITEVTAQKHERQQPTLLIIANHIHMRRVLGAFRVLSAGKIDLYWISVSDPSAYTKNVHQARFRHSSWFLAYEIIALAYSKLKGWA